MRVKMCSTFSARHMHRHNRSTDARSRFALRNIRAHVSSPLICHKILWFAISPTLAHATFRLNFACAYHTVTAHQTCWLVRVLAIHLNGHVGRTDNIVCGPMDPRWNHVCCMTCYCACYTSSFGLPVRHSGNYN